MQTKFTYLKLSAFEISIFQKVIFVRQITTRVFLYRGPHVKNEHIFWDWMNIPKDIKFRINKKKNNKNMLKECYDRFRMT